MYQKTTLTIFLSILLSFNSYTQPGSGTKWSPDGSGYYEKRNGSIAKFDLATSKYKEIISQKDFIPAGQTKPLTPENFSFTDDQSKLLIFTNSQRVWRYNTRGDYWLIDIETKKLTQLGKSLPQASLMFAKISPDGTHAAYVSNRNIYVENLTTGRVRQLTSTGNNNRLINGTFDWAYEEEFHCYDGFRWSPDSKQIAYWQIDASGIKNFDIINNTDEIYSKVIPIEYPKVGENPSACRIGVITLKSGKTKWMDISGDPQQHYIPRMEWLNNSEYVMLQQLDRKQQLSKIIYANTKTGESTTVFEEKDNAWVDVRTIWNNNNPAGWQWINSDREFLWVSEKDGWNHLYKISKDGKEVKLITDEAYDIIDPLMYDAQTDHVYFTASPDNSTQKYLYRVSAKGGSKAERLTPDSQSGYHQYVISAKGNYALHTFSNHYTPIIREWISLPDHKPLDPTNGVQSKIDPVKKEASNIIFFTITTKSGVEMDGWMALPTNFDPKKKYAAVFLVYAEPASQENLDNFQAGKNSLYNGNMADDGYIYVTIDGRGSPAPKGRAWRKSIYKNIGMINIQDQAEGALALLEKYPFIDKDRMAVHGWSGGGSTTLNLLFKYPEVFQTGIAIAAVANQLTYDNIYQERYMGVPPEDLQGFIDGSPIHHVQGLKGNLLYIHGTGDDNVHYQNAEMLINELIKHGKQFQFMAYPNRTHGIYEGAGTRNHLNTLFTNFLKEHCPPGGR
jgi:dipeptidyl-peptidase-4